MLAQAAVLINGTPVAGVTLICATVHAGQLPFPVHIDQGRPSAIAILGDRLPRVRGGGTGGLHGVREDTVSLVHRIVALAQVGILSTLATSSRVREIVRLAMDTHTKDPDRFPDFVRRGVDLSGVVIAERPPGEPHDCNVVGVRPVSVAIEWAIRVSVCRDGVVLVV